ncbi:MAG: hypothetical protein WCG03_02145 [Kiritimatiellales bacterium]
MKFFIPIAAPWIDGMDLKIPSNEPVEWGFFLKPVKHIFLNNRRLQSEDPFKIIRPDTTTMLRVLGVKEAEVYTKGLTGFMSEAPRKRVLEHLVPQPAPYLNNVHKNLYSTTDYKDATDLFDLS